MPRTRLPAPSCTSTSLAARRLLRSTATSSAPAALRPLCSAYTRPYSTFSPPSSSSSPQEPQPATPPLKKFPSRWLADLRARVGRCLAFGCTAEQVSGRAAGVVRALAREWRVLVAGNEGFLTGEVLPARYRGQGRGRLLGLQDQAVVWGEMDAFGHVNNVTYARYAESGRVNWINYLATHFDPAHAREWRELMTPRTVGLIMKSLTTEFKFPMTYPDRISVFHRLATLPAADATSLSLDCVVLSHRHRRAAATLREEVTVYDYRRAAKTAVPPFVRDVLADVWRLQEGAARAARLRIAELTREVEALERETWDRPGAVEDMGSSSGGKGAAKEEGKGEGEEEKPPGRASTLVEAATIAVADALTRA